MVLLQCMNMEKRNLFNYIIDDFYYCKDKKYNVKVFNDVEDNVSTILDLVNWQYSVLDER